MKSYIFSKLILTIAFVLLLLTVSVLIRSKAEEKEVVNRSTKKQEVTYPTIEIDVRNHPSDSLVYNPVDNALSSITQEKNIYKLSTWQQENGWTYGSASWKTKKNECLDNFSYNAIGALFACLKSYKKGQLYKQDIVRLHKNGKIQSLSLIGLKNASLQRKSSCLNEITNVQCHGTSLAITYQYGIVKIYNIAERQALGAENMTGTPGHSLFYDHHYITVTKNLASQEVLLQDFDIRSGEITRSFPLGGNGQDSADFHLSSYQNDLYLLSSRGIFSGSFTETVLTQQSTYYDLHLPDYHHINYWQAARDRTIYIGYKTSDNSFHLRYMNLG